MLLLLLLLMKWEHMKLVIENLWKCMLQHWLCSCSFSLWLPMMSSVCLTASAFFGMPGAVFYLSLSLSTILSLIIFNTVGLIMRTFFLVNNYYQSFSVFTVLLLILLEFNMFQMEEKWVHFQTYLYYELSVAVPTTRRQSLVSECRRDVWRRWCLLLSCSLPPSSVKRVLKACCIIPC